MGIQPAALGHTPHHPDVIVASGEGAIILNDYDPAETEALLDLISSTSTGEAYSPVPSCGCETTESIAILGVGHTEVCPYCRTKVSKSYDRSMKAMVFIRAPEGVAPLITMRYVDAFVSTYSIDKRAQSGTEAFSAFRYLTDTSYRSKNQKATTAMNELEIPRGYNYFITNMIPILEQLAGCPMFANRKKVKSGAVRLIWEKTKDQILTNHLGLIHRDLFIVEQHATKNTLFKGMTEVSVVATMFLGIDQYETNTLEFRENITGKALIRLAEFYKAFYKTLLPGKNGLIMKDALAARGVCGARLIVIPEVLDVEYDAVRLPWGPALIMLKLHLINKLSRRGMDLLTASAYIDDHTSIYCPLLEELFYELVAENPDKCIPVFEDRFPTLTKGNIGYARAWHIKTDVSDPALSIPVSAIASSNTDFDGDGKHVEVISTVGVQKAITRSYTKNTSNADLIGGKVINSFMFIPRGVMSNGSQWYGDTDYSKHTNPGITLDLLNMYGA